jgi:hypothetical protein
MPCYNSIPEGEEIVEHWENDERVVIINLLDDIGQPYSCNMWGNAGNTGIPIIIDDGAGHTLHDLFELVLEAYPVNVFLDHEMNVVNITESEMNQTAVNNMIQGMIDNISGISGCTDPNACNYNPAATEDDGTCEDVVDCEGACGGTAVMDDCGACGGESECVGQMIQGQCVNGDFNVGELNANGFDCAGWCLGTFSYGSDECYDCAGTPNGDAVVDCEGICGGATTEDECGVCDGMGEQLHCRDLDGDGWGTSEFTFTTCDIEGDIWVTNCDDIDDSIFCESNEVDCAGDCEGSLVNDECGVCAGDNSSCLDECGVTNGDNSTCLDECGVPNGNGMEDYYADWDGDGFGDCLEVYTVCPNETESWMSSECAVYGCTGESSCNYNSEANIDDGSCIYPETNYDCYGDCTAGVDCNGDCGGSAMVDACGVCNGGNAACFDSLLSERYHTYSEIQEQLFAWDDEFGNMYNPNYPNAGIMYELIEIGRSHEDEFPFWAVKLSYEVNENNDKPKILILGQSNAENILGVEISMALIDILLHPNPFSDLSAPQVYVSDDQNNAFRPNQELTPMNIQEILETTEVWVVPTHNPEGLSVVHGYEDNGTWVQDETYRKNKHDLDGNNIFNFIVGQGNDSDGVDLDRNYDFNWINGDGIYEPDNGGNNGCNSSYFVDFDYYRGAEPFSETETQAIRDLALEENFLISIIYGSSRSGCMSQKIKYSWNWSDTLFSPDFEVIGHLGENIASHIGRVDAGTYEPSFSGSFKGNSHNWFYAKIGTFQYKIYVGEGGVGMQPSETSHINGIIHNNLRGAFYAINRTAGINSGNLGADSYMVTGLVTDGLTGLPISGAEVKILEMDGSVLSPRLCDEFGRFRRLLIDESYTVQIDALGYVSQEFSITPSSNSITYLDISLESLSVNDTIGDTNFDGIVDILDIVRIINQIMGNSEFNDDEFTAADFNADGIVDILDIVQIVNYILAN